MAKISRKEIRNMILEQMSMPQIDPDIQRMASEIQVGTIMDFSNMEGTGGGKYPVYKVENGQARLVIEDLGDVAYLISQFAEETADYGRSIMSSAGVYMYPDETALSAMGY